MTKKHARPRGEQSPERMHAALAQLARRADGDEPALGSRSLTADDLAAMVAADLIVCRADGQCQLTASGRARLARGELARLGGPVDPYRAQHLGLTQRKVGTADGERHVTVDQAESPLAWLARRKGKDGKAHIEPDQLQAGERLRADFTCAQMMPRITSNWDAPVTQDARGGVPGSFGDAAVAARQRVRNALDAAGQEFAGLLLDVCCFLKRLEDVERERGWPPRSAKVVLQLGLDRLARHYGYGAQVRGPAHAALRTWLAPDAEFSVDGAEDRRQA